MFAPADPNAELANEKMPTLVLADATSGIIEEGDA